MVANPSITAVVPMKPLAESKTRLGGHLSAKERADLSAVMLKSVLEALRDSRVFTTIVVGGDERVRKISLGAGACWKTDRFMDLNLAVDETFGRVWRAGHLAVYIPGDLPLLAASDIDHMLELATAGRGMTICPAHDGGTNALVVPPCVKFPPQLGRESHRRHRELAAKLGIEMKEFCSPGFNLDVDTIEDLRECFDRSPGHMQSLLKAGGVFYR